MCSRFLPRLHANIKCGLSQCLPYLPVPCYAVAYVLQETRLISLLLAEWIKKTQIQCVVVVSFLLFFPSPLCARFPLSCRNLHKKAESRLLLRPQANLLRSDW